MALTCIDESIAKLTPTMLPSEACKSLLAEGLSKKDVTANWHHVAEAINPVISSGDKRNLYHLLIMAADKDALEKIIIDLIDAGLTFDDFNRLYTGSYDGLNKKKGTRMVLPSGGGGRECALPLWMRSKNDHHNRGSVINR